MTTLGQSIKTALNSVRSLKGETVTYRTATLDVELTAARLKGRRLPSTQETMTIDADAQDWSIARAELIDTDGNPITPDPAHVILATAPDGSTETYALNAEADSPCYENQDADRTSYRIHTRKIS